MSEASTVFPTEVHWEGEGTHRIPFLTYTSDELDVKLVVEAKGDKLLLRRRPADEIELRPAYADDFAAPGLGSLRFSRNASGRVTGFSIFAGRVIDVRFTRAAR